MDFTVTMFPPLRAYYLLFASFAIARADVRLPAIISDHMVLQRDVDVPVWGFADPGEEVSVMFADQSKSVHAGADGKWKVTLSNLKSGAPQSMTIKGRNTITVLDVLVGEVWLGAGQSNMRMTVDRANDFDTERASARFPLIRQFKVENATAATPLAETNGKWVICQPDTVGSFAAALYFFGRELHQILNVPVGLVTAAVGGTPIELWIASDAQRASAELKPFFAALDKQNSALLTPAAIKKYEADLAAWEANAKQPQAEKQKVVKRPENPVDVAARRSKVGGHFENKIAPLIPYAIRGMLWYQGEANTFPFKASFYQAQLSLLVRDWRARWGSEFPIAWAQLPNYIATGRDWPTVREAMLKALSLPKTGMIITIDIGEPNDIHPRNKQEVGRRFALWALGAIYQHKIPAISGPLPAGHEVRGNEIVVSFKHADHGLVAKDGELRGFLVAGADRQWQAASARIVGNAVIVSSPAVKAPVAARYAWENLPSCNLYNTDGLPASPFRTDDWK